jgi:hypothetical protein
MRRIIRKWIPIFIATTSGLLALAGYLFPDTGLSVYRDRLVEWAVIIGAFALILGVFNVLRVHGQRILESDKGQVYSVVLLVAALVSFVPPLVYGPTDSLTRGMVDYVITPLGGALAALVVFTLTLSAVRLLRHRRGPSSLLFIVVVILTLLGTTPLRGFEWLSEIRSWLVGVPGMAGVRGLLLGVALGTVITGIRVLLGSERPHSEF